MKELNNLSYGLFVVTAKTSKMNGCVSNSVVQVTNEPNVLAVSLNKQNLTTQMILETKKLNVSVLDSSTNFELIKHFGFASGKNTDKFEGFKDYKIAANGIAYITKSVNSYLSLEVFDEKDLGSHIMFFATVSASESLSNLPSVTYADYHAKIKPKPKKKGYICTVCGYVHESDELPNDFICPICKQGASVFVKITEEQQEKKEGKTMDKYICPICGYKVESESAPDKCVICGAEMKKVEE